MEHERESHKALRLIIFCLYLLPILAFGEDAITIFLYATKQLDDVALLSLILAFVGAQLSLVYLFFHALLARKHRLAGLYPPRRSFLHSLCRDTLRIVMLVWIAASATGLIVAARQPECLPGNSSREFWRFGTSCKLHRATVAIAVSAMVLSCTLFCAIQLSDRPFHASFAGIYDPDPGRHFDLGHSPSGSSWSSGSSGSSLKRQKLNHTRSNEVEYYMPGRTQQLQRVQNQSYQSAVYPPSLRYSVNRPLSPHRLQRTPSGNLRPTTPYGQFSLAPQPPISRSAAPFSIFSPNRAKAPASRKSPLSHMRRVSEPEVPAIPERFRDAKRSSKAKQESVLPENWSPTLLHPPLSADPAIQAFSIDVDEAEDGRSSKSNPFTRRFSTAFTKRRSGARTPCPASTETIRLVRPDADDDFVLQDPPRPTSKPKVPARAKGHNAKPKIMRSSLPSPSIFRPASLDYVEAMTEPRRISRTPSHPPSDLHIPRSRPHSVRPASVPSIDATLRSSIDRSYEVLRKESLDEPRDSSRASSPPPIPPQSPRRKLSKRPPSESRSRSRSHSRSRSRSRSISQSLPSKPPSQPQPRPPPPSARSFSLLRPPLLPTNTATAASSIYSRPVSTSPSPSSRNPSTHSSLAPTPPIPPLSVPLPRITQATSSSDHLEILRISRHFSSGVAPPLPMPSPSPQPQPHPQKLGTTTTISATGGIGTGGAGGAGAPSAIGRGERHGRSVYGAYAFACSPFDFAAAASTSTSTSTVEGDAEGDMERERGRGRTREREMMTTTELEGEGDGVGVGDGDREGVKVHRLTRVRSREGRLVRRREGSGSGSGNRSGSQQRRRGRGRS